MTETERIEIILHYCRFAHYPEPLVSAISDYLAGQGTLDAVQQHRQTGLPSIFTFSPPLVNWWFFFAHALPDLDMLDCRLLDICTVTSQVWTLLDRIANHDLLHRALEYLLSQGMAEEGLVQNAAQFLYLAVDNEGRPTRLGHRLLSLLPRYFEELLLPETFGTAAQTVRNGSHGFYLLRLLAAAEPPPVDLAWEVVQRTQPTQEPETMNTLGLCATLLLKVAPDRFTPWVRQIAGPESPGSLLSRRYALEALLAHDAARHIDLAVAAARADLPPHNWRANELRSVALDALYRLDPITYLPVVAEVALSRSPWITHHALTFLLQADAERARPYLQRCVAEGGIAASGKALEALLQRQWDERQDYALSLLTHHSKRIRAQASAWLAEHSEQISEQIAPLLTHASSDIRLTAVQTLASFGGKEARALLAARLEVERAPKVKQAIFEAVGLPGAEQSTAPFSTETIIARARATLCYVHRPAPRWVDVQEITAPHWTGGEPVPPEVLLYLLYEQSRVIEPGMLAEPVHQALRLISSTTGNLARTLFKGWTQSQAKAKEVWLLPLICTLADEQLLPGYSRRIEEWSRTNQRGLAIHMLQAMPLLESDTTLAELTVLAKSLQRGIVKKAAKAVLEGMPQHAP